MRATWLSDAAMDKIIYMSPACWDMWKMDRSRKDEDQWIFLQSIHPEDLPAVLNAQKLLLERGVIYSGEFRIICGDGEQEMDQGESLPGV